MNIFKRKSNSDSIKTAIRMDGMGVKYVAIRNADATERIIGRNGRISVYDGVVRVVCSAKAVFSCALCEVCCNELLSGDGVVFSGRDIESGQDMVLTVYFTELIRRK